MKDTDVVVDLQQLDATLASRAVRLARPGRLTYTSAQIGASDLEVLVGASTLSARGAIGAVPGPETLALTLDTEGLNPLEAAVYSILEAERLPRLLR